MAQVRLTWQAEQDLLDAWQHVAEDNPAAADNLAVRRPGRPSGHE